MRTYGLLLFGFLAIANVGHAQQRSSLADALLFHASFDESADADFAKGDAKVYTAKSLKREDVQAGLHSDAVNLNRRGGRYGGALSFTDKKWNDASFFVDFSKESPRTFRLGVFSDTKFWNPRDRKWDDIPADERPLVTVDKPPFSRDKWTHVGITFRGFNQKDQTGVAMLYLNGASQGDLRRKQRFTWSNDRLAIMLGIYYVGQFDDFAIFNRALTAAEMKRVSQFSKGIALLEQE